MSKKTKALSEVLVVGAGPVGMFTALKLAESGIGVQVIDQAPCTARNSCACALHPHTLQLLETSGILDEALKLGHRVEKIAFYDGNLRRAEMDLSLLPVEFPFVLVLEQNILERLLEQKLKEKAGLEVRWSHRLTDLAMKNGAASATIHELSMEGKGYGVPHFDVSIEKTFSMEANFIIGANGQGSLVRQRLNIEYERVGQPQLFVIYEFETEATLPSEMRIVLDERADGVLWPFSQHEGRWGFQCLLPSSPAEFPQKSHSRLTVADSPGPNDGRHHLEKLLSARAPWFKDEIKDIGWAADVKFEHRLARQFGREQGWLVGDAAHQTGPLGMQSMNMGFREGADLATRMTKILREHSSPDLLETYDLEQRLEWEHLLGLKGDPITSGTTDEWIRRHAARIPACLPASGSELTMLLTQLGLEFESASLQMVGA